jgi:hypothetical protein
MAESTNQGDAIRGMWASGQGVDMVSSPANAMTAPGSPPAAHDIPDGAPPAVVPEHGDWRETVHGGEPPGGASWEDVSERPWPGAP